MRNFITNSTKRHFFILLLLGVLVLCYGIFGLGRAEAQTLKNVDAISYNMNLTLNTSKNSLSENVIIKFKNNTDKTVRKIYLRDMTPGILKYDMKNYGESNKDLSTAIKSVTLKGSKKKLNITYKRNKTVLIVDLGKKGSLKPGETGEVKVRMKTDIPNREDRFGYQKTKKGKLYALSFCFPYLADNLNGKWQLDPYFDDGESRSWDLADYKITFKAPKGYKVAATGSNKTTSGKTIIRAKNVRDMAIVACNFMSKDSFTVKGIKVNNYYLKGKNRAGYRKLTKLVAKDSLRLFTENIGKYPYDELDIVPCLFGFGFGGMEYPGLVMTNATSFFSTSMPDYWSLSEGLSHEIGHQWFYAAVGNREYKEGWIDEAFTTYLERDVFGLSLTDSYKYVREKDSLFPSLKKSRAARDERISYARKEYKSIYVNTPPNKYHKGQTYGDAEYEEGYVFLEEIRLKMGDEKFNRFLKEYYESFCMKRATTSKIVKLIRKYDNSKAMNKIIAFYVE